MKERPIIFSAPMARAIMEGRKTMTRRQIKTITVESAAVGRHRVKLTEADHSGNDMRADFEEGMFACPYGQIGDRLWVREAFMAVGYGGFGQTIDSGYERFETIGIEFAAGGDPVTFDFLNGTAIDGTPESVDYAMASRMSDSGPEGYRPSIHMPRWASRIALEVTGVRVERLQDITNSDATAEGCQAIAGAKWQTFAEADAGSPMHDHTARDAFAGLWDAINGEGSWAANPWVWVVEFKRVEAQTA